MATKFEAIYSSFLNSVDSYDFAQVDESELEEILWGYLDSARTNFITYHKDFYDVDLEQKTFNIELNGAEVAVLAKAMKLEWTSRNKNAQELHQKAIGDRDYQAVQGTKYIETLGKAERQLRTEIEMWINKYEYSQSDLYGEMA